MCQSRKTTLTERIEITQNTIVKNYNYQEASEEYGVSYQQIYNWVRKYNDKMYDSYDYIPFKYMLINGFIFIFKYW
ncbi:transposase [Mammaliicoccus sciuri]|uniref:transposase n=1 Tax=Mammaliicoccus sciuri TaxID=1296 RepID=UPI003F5664FB